MFFVVVSLENNMTKLKFKSGFPNTMNPDWQVLSINDKNKDIEIKGDDLGGYYIKLNNNDDNNEEYTFRIMDRFDRCRRKC